MNDFKAFVMNSKQMPFNVCIHADSAEQAKTVLATYVAKLGLTKYQYDETPTTTSIAVFPFIN